MITAFITKICAFFMALISTLIPFVNYDAENKDEILLNVAMISDIHIDTTLPVGKLMLTLGLQDIKRNATENDAVIVSGDLTNYGDKESVADFYEIFAKVNPAENWIIAPGNHDIGHNEDYHHDEVRQWLIDYNNQYTGAENENIYFSKEVKGYTFIVLCDQSEDNWDGCDIYEDQIEFLDQELAKATADGKPAFVICHWPLPYTNGQQAIYEDSGLDGYYAKRVRTTLEKYRNVFFISGHMHKGISGDKFQDIFGFSSVETIEGVTYVNLPSYGIVNRYGIPWNGIGMQMEVYENEVVFRPRRYLYSKWYAFIDYRVPVYK